MTPDDSLAALAAVLGYEFDNLTLMEEALTHPSAAGAGVPSYERLEFLGDRVLGLVLAELLIAAFPGEAEGDLTRRYHAMARKEAARDVARGLNLGRYLRVARGEESMRSSGTAVADAMEAVIAAIYLDGGLAAARRFIVDQWQPVLARTPDPPRDAKTALQVWVQQQNWPLPVYTEVARSGPAHAPHFVMSVAVGAAESDAGRTGRGEGASKRTAEQAAAAALLEQLQNDE